MNAGRSIVEDENIASGEEIVGEEFAQGEIGRPPFGISRRYEIADIPVEDELSERLGEVLSRKIARPLGIVCGIPLEDGLLRGRGISRPDGGLFEVGRRRLRRTFVVWHRWAALSREKVMVRPGA